MITHHEIAGVVRPVGACIQVAESFTERVELSPDLPETMDLRSYLTRMEDQGQKPICAGEACSGIIEESRNRQGLPKVELSPDWFWKKYQMEALGRIDVSQGATISGILKIASEVGCVPADRYQVDIGTLAETPPPELDVEAAQIKVLMTTRLPNIDTVCRAIADGMAVAFGCDLPRQMMSETPPNADGVVLFDANEERMGGHAMKRVGYDLKRKLWLVENSWSSDWWLDGYCWMSWDYDYNGRCFDKHCVRAAS